MKVGFLFGAGAEAGYGLPSGGKFALEIFRQDTTEIKELFKELREKIDGSTYYAASWLPDDYKTKSVSSFGKTVFEAIIKDTIEHNREKIIARINDFDAIAKEEEGKLKGSYSKTYTQIVNEVLGTPLKNCNMKHEISFIDYFNEGNKLFESNYFSSLLKLYKTPGIFEVNTKYELRKIILAIFQLQIGALSENLTRKINDGIFKDKDDSIDFLDDIGDVIQLNSQSTGLAGLEYVMENKTIELNSNGDLILSFARNIIETIYSSVLDYKSLIDSNWHYLYCPKDEWAKFCKINIFLLSVREYIVRQLGDGARIKTDGYYHDLISAIEKNIIKTTTIATTNYNVFIQETLKQDICFLNGSTDIWYDPYVNRLGKKEELSKREQHFLVPLIFTQSGTKPMTSIEMSKRYVNMYENFKKSDKLCIVGFGFNKDDEHINGILRTLIDIDDKKVIVIDLDNGRGNENFKETIVNKLKIYNEDNLEIVLVGYDRKVEGVSWLDRVRYL
ncbi:hypothetical protein JHL18_17050 [Clostridium sp. YIM B02505]|uniref:SIR2-like domain-containing protein n=1 Tax=Clostridium yunnanense TaxID=2800325 RepID=A0ABS1ESH9_9CLOT|nr:hypothetical protein [Clostridium yunnanense]MBK1812334.1 hypothetical protein [Clostridium yunnanense]